MESLKKKRSENWLSEEKEILRQLIYQSAHIIEDKSTKTNVNVMKTKEWKKISEKFNELTGKHRTDVELKLAWKRMKLAAKANVSAHRREQTKTGGGEKPPSPSAEDLEIMAIAPHDFVIEVNDYDSDAVIPVTMADTQKETCADSNPGARYEETGVIVINEEYPRQFVVEEISSNIKENIEIGNNETTKKKQPIKKKQKTSQHTNRTEDVRTTIVQSNTNFKNKQLEMLEVEHKYNVKIAELTIQKMELEIDLLQTQIKNKTKE